MTPRQPQPNSGLLASTFLKLVARAAEVRAVEPIGDHFRLVTLGGPDLEDRAWTPGDRLQISLGGWENRTYTPLAFDAARGTTDFLAYLHGNGIGSAWIASLRGGEPCHLVGPRSAVNLSALRRPAVFFGDETSFSTAAALRATASAYSDVKFLFEVSSVPASRAVLDRLGMTGAIALFARDDRDRHLDDIEREVLAAFRSVPATDAVFTGKASSIQRLYKSLRRSGVSSRQVTNVAYWAPGRRGFSGAQR